MLNMFVALYLLLSIAVGNTGGVRFNVGNELRIALSTRKRKRII